jgi:hypothetical protein
MLDGTREQADPRRAACLIAAGDQPDARHKGAGGGGGHR